MEKERESETETDRGISLRDSKLSSRVIVISPPYDSNTRGKTDTMGPSPAPKDQWFAGVDISSKALRNFSKTNLVRLI